MARQFERSEDREREAAVADRLCEVSGLQAVKLPPFYPLDYLLIRKDGSFFSWVEIKCRKNTRLHYPDFIISLSKIMSMNHLSAETGVPCRLAIGWTDGVGVLQLPSPYRLGLNRADRGSAGDRDPVCHFDTSRFTMI